MKKTLCVLVFTIFVVTLLPLNVFAEGNSSASATKVSLGKKYTHFYAKEESGSYWYCFTPSATDCYEISLDFNGDITNDIGSSYINCYDENDELDHSLDYAPNKKACFGVREMKANCTYYFDAICFQNNQNANFCITTHKHTLTQDLTKATDQQDGYLYSECSTCDLYYSEVNIPRINKVSLSNKSFVYDGKSKTPTVVIKDREGQKLTSNKDYSVNYKNNKKVGKATVTIKFKGNYSGTKKISFKIVPKGTSLKSIKKKTKGFTVKWKKNTSQTSGYQIQYSTNKEFTKNKKTITINKNKTTSKTVTKLKSNTKYFVRIRTYKVVEGKKYYSSWSKVLNTKTKKHK